MRIPNFLRRRLLHRFRRWAMTRGPDLMIGNGYLYRWRIFRSRRIGCIYLHLVNGDDDDRALHDHPAWNMSVILEGKYWEHMPGGIAVERTPGTVIARGAKALHRLSISEGPVWTLFIFGPKYRTWGFQFPDGWVPWYEVVDTDGSEKRKTEEREL